MKLSAVWMGCVGAGTLVAACELVADLDSISGSQLVSDASIIGNDTMNPKNEAGAPDTSMPLGNSWCSQHKSPQSFSCLDFDESTKAPVSPNQNGCLGNVSSSSSILSNSGPNALIVSCNPITSSDITTTDYIKYGYKTFYSSPNGITLNMDVYLAGFDPTSATIDLFRVGLADGSWFMRYRYDDAADGGPRTASLLESISSNPALGIATIVATHPVPQMIMSTAPAWYNLSFSVDFVTNRVWLSFGPDEANATQIPFDGGATSFTASFPIFWNGDGGTVNTWHASNDGGMEVLWGLDTAISPFQATFQTPLSLQYDNVDIEPVPATGIGDAGPIFP